MGSSYIQDHPIIRPLQYNAYILLWLAGSA